MKDFTLPLRCCFCHSTGFAIPHEGYKPSHGERVACASCGRENDYSTLHEAVREKAVEIAKDEVHAMLKNVFKGHKNITLKIG